MSYKYMSLFEVLLCQSQFLKLLFDQITKLQITETKRSKYRIV